MRYPAFTGTEPCTELGPDVYQIDHYTPSMLEMLKETCSFCHMLGPCREWALRHEGRSSGFWAGMTGNERATERKRRNIVFIDPVVVVSRASA